MKIKLRKCTLPSKRGDTDSRFGVFYPGALSYESFDTTGRVLEFREIGLKPTPHKGSVMEQVLSVFRQVTKLDDLTLDDDGDVSVRYGSPFWSAPRSSTIGFACSRFLSRTSRKHQHSCASSIRSTMAITGLGSFGATMWCMRFWTYLAIPSSQPTLSPPCTNSRKWRTAWRSFWGPSSRARPSLSRPIRFRAPAVTGDHSELRRDW